MINVISEETLDLDLIASKQKAVENKQRKYIDSKLGSGTYDKLKNSAVELANQPNFAKAWVDYNKHLLSKIGELEEDGVMKAVTLTAIIASLQGAAGSFILNALVKLAEARLGKRITIPNEQKVQYLIMIAALISPVMEELAKLYAKKHGFLEDFLIIFNAFEAGQYILLSRFKPTAILLRIYLAALHNVSGVVLNREDLTTKEKLAINISWHYVNNLIAVSIGAMQLLIMAEVTRRVPYYKPKVKDRFFKMSPKFKKLNKAGALGVLTSLPVALGTGQLISNKKENKNA